MNAKQISTGCDNCPTVFDPVCVGSAGQIISFDNICLAFCAGFDQGDLIECDTTATGCDACPTVVDPVCIATPSGGFITFQNECFALCEGYNQQDLVECDTTNNGNCGSFSATILSTDQQVCAGDAVVLSVDVTGGSAPYSYLWSTQNASTPTITVTPPTTTTYTVVVADGSGCAITLTAIVFVEECQIDSTCTDSTNCVFPGDANNTLRVNNYDILNIGFGFGTAGPARSEISIAPQFFTSTDWNTNGINGVNLKFADCNGDGTINETDVSAIEQNYDSEAEFDENIKSSEPGIAVSVEFSTDTIIIGNGAGDSSLIYVEADLVVNQQNAVIPIQGLALQINFENSGVELVDAYVEFENDSWLADNNNTISVQRFIADAQRLDLGISRTDQVPVTGAGRIGKIYLAIEDIIIGRVQNENVLVDAAVENVIVIGSSEDMVSVTGQVDDVVLSAEGVPTGINEQLLQLIKVYPNPAKYFIQIDANIEIQIIQLMSIDGQIISSAKLTGSQLDISQLPASNYILRIVTKQGVLTRKIIKVQ